MPPLSTNWRPGLNQTALGKRLATVISHDRVIQKADVDRLQGLAQPARDQLVGLTGLGDSGRMLGCISGCHRHLFLSVPGYTVPHTFSSPSLD
jgi:hypothetical protein